MAISLYKAFVEAEATDNIDMIVDTSGDTFSGTIEDAIRSHIAQAPKVDVFNIPMASIFGEDPNDGKLLTVENRSKPSDILSQVVLVKVTLMDDADLERGLLDGDLEKNREVLFAIKKCSDGHVTAMGEYHIDEITIVYPSKGDETQKGQITKFRATRTSNESEHWPEKIFFKANTKLCNKALPRKNANLDKPDEVPDEELAEGDDIVEAW